MDQLLEAAKSGTARRLVALVVGIGAVLFNKKLGLDLDTSDEVGLVSMICAYLLGSNAKEASVKRAEIAADAAAAKVVTTADALRAMEPPK